MAGLHPQAPALRIGHLPGPPAAYAASHQQESGLLSRLLVGRDVGWAEQLRVSQVEGAQVGQQAPSFHLGGLVFFDRCNRCERLWFDADELGAMALMWGRMNARIEQFRAENRQALATSVIVVNRGYLRKAVWGLLFW